MGKKKIIAYFFGGLFVCIASYSCRVINSNALFQIPKNIDFAYDSLPLVPNENYKRSRGDRFSFVFSTNKGEKIVLSQSGVSLDNQNNNVFGNQNQQNRITYLIREDGTTELPIIGEISVAGLTIVEFEDTLESLLSKTYLDPYVQINITNQRVVVFPGRGQARVVYLQNTNTSLLEVIALAGGISNDGKAYSIKLMRTIKNKSKREVYKVDLSTIDGIKQAEMLVQSNDYIYVDYKPRYAGQVLIELGPWLSLVTTTLAVIAIFR